MDKNDILKICQSAGYTEGTLICGGFVNGKHYVSYGQDDAECVSNIGNLFSGLYKRRSTVRRIRHQQTTAGTGEQGKPLWRWKARRP